MNAAENHKIVYVSPLTAHTQWVALLNGGAGKAVLEQALLTRTELAELAESLQLPPHQISDLMGQLETFQQLYLNYLSGLPANLHDFTLNSVELRQGLGGLQAHVLRLSARNGESVISLPVITLQWQGQTRVLFFDE